MGVYMKSLFFLFLCVGFIPAWAYLIDPCKVEDILNEFKQSLLLARESNCHVVIVFDPDSAFYFENNENDDEDCFISQFLEFLSLPMCKEDITLVYNSSRSIGTFDRKNTGEEGELFFLFGDSSTYTRMHLDVDEASRFSLVPAPDFFIFEYGKGIYINSERRPLLYRDKKVRKAVNYLNRNFESRLKVNNTVYDIDSVNYAELLEELGKENAYSENILSLPHDWESLIARYKGYPFQYAVPHRSLEYRGWWNERNILEVCESCSGIAPSEEHIMADSYSLIHPAVNKGNALIVLMALIDNVWSVGRQGFPYEETCLKMFVVGGEACDITMLNFDQRAGAISSV